MARQRTMQVSACTSFSTTISTVAAHGTNRTSTDVRSSVAIGGKSDDRPAQSVDG